MVPETTAEKQKHRFQKGKSGNPAGRPKGSRNKLSEDFLASLTQDFEKHGQATIRALRVKRPEVYIKIVADLVPKDIHLKHDASDAFASIWAAISGGAA